ncbi:3'-5' exonuclease [bacterium]|nr:MAG: 3'-5' exonuclease [bacterium]
MYLFFDTETNGLPKNYNAPLSDLDNWPRIVQIAWLEQDKNGNTISKGNYFVKPDGFEITEESQKIHRISNEKANDLGYPIANVMEVFNAVIKKSTYLVAHNIDFDYKVLSSEFARLYLKSDLEEKTKICTMQETVEFCNLPGSNGLKFPKLAELYYKLFAKNFDNAHDAQADIEATAKCFWSLLHRGIIDTTQLRTVQSIGSAKQVDEKMSEDDGNISLF